MRISRLLFLTLFFPALIACAPMVKDGQPIAAHSEIVLRAGQTVGQTFTARDRGLNGVEIFLAPDTPNIGEMRLHLRARPQSSDDIATATLAVSAVTQPGFYRFAFAPQRDSRGRDYYVVLELSDGALRVGTASGETYLDGALYQNDQPLDAQMAFRLAYDPIELTIGLAAMAVTWLQVLGVAVALFVLPGWALLMWLLPGWRALSWMERIGLASGMSIALYPLLILWTAVFDLHVGALYAWVPVLVALGALVWREAGSRRRVAGGGEQEAGGRWQEAVRNLRFAIRNSQFVIVSCELLLIGIVIFTRLWVIRSLDVPMWGDSYHHTMIAQLLVDNGGLFDSWLPYAPYRTLTVQFGFPAAAAIFAWLTETNSARAILWVGQIINVLAVTGLYPLAVRIAQGNRWAGVGAVLVAGLFSPMPAFYINWGRYAQLAGQAILPAALWLLWSTLENERRNSRLILVSSIILAGMMLNYYRMPFYYATFVLALLIFWGIPRWRIDIHQWREIATRLALVIVLSMLVFLPWFVNISQSNLANAVEGGVRVGSSLDSVLQDYRIWKDLFYYVPVPLVLLGLFALVGGYVRKNWLVLLLGFWVASLVSLVAGRLIRLPGANMIQNFAVLIALYIPVSLLCGWVISRIVSGIEGLTRSSGQVIVTIILVSAGILAVMQQQHIVIAQPMTFAMVTRADLRAMAWIKENVPVDARFLVEGFRIYGGRSSVGADAGWWIPLFTRRANTMPPQYALLNEVPIRSNYSQDVTDLVAHLEKVSPASLEGLQHLCDWGITHVYIGQRQGKVGAGVIQLFASSAFMDKDAFSLVYHEDRVYVFALDLLQCERNR